MAHFSHRPVLKVSSPFQMSIRDFHLFCPSDDFPSEGGVVPFWDDIHSKYLIITSRARSTERVLRGLIEKSKYEQPDTTRHDTTRPHDAFEELISLQPQVRSRTDYGLLWWVATSLLP